MKSRDKKGAFKAQDLEFKMRQKVRQWISEDTPENVIVGRIMSYTNSGSTWSREMYREVLNEA